jgi:hypothetical protein
MANQDAFFTASLPLTTPMGFTARAKRTAYVASDGLPSLKVSSGNAISEVALPSKSVQQCRWKL